MLFNKLKYTIAGVTTALISMAISPVAVSQEAEYQKFCDKLKVCMVENMKAQGAYQPGLEQFIEPVLEQACQQGLAQYQDMAEKSKDDPKMKEKTNACLDSFLEKSCDEMIGQVSQGNSISPECSDAEQYGKEKGYITQ